MKKFKEKGVKQLLYSCCSCDSIDGQKRLLSFTEKKETFRDI
jgi:hypothetical protein